MSTVPASGSLGALLVSLALVPLACNPTPIQIESDTESDPGTTGTTGSSSPTSPTSPTDPDSSGGDDGPMPTERQVDLLFVIDNSGSMGEEQAVIAQSIDVLVDALNGTNPPVDYRIGVTTTDNGNPWCQGTGPEAGKLRATSCRARPTEFVFEGAQTIDATQEACYDVCSLENLEELGLTDLWVEVNGTTGTANVPVDMIVETLRCMLPQGIDGCGFEQPLESLWKAWRRSDTPGDPSFGFARPGALPVAVIITDEADCSYNNEWETIFLPDGERVFWSDPTAAAPSSAVCWNAGVTCFGSETYDDCISVDLDEDGNEVPPEFAADNAVLRPISRYIDAFAERGALVMAINGVGVDGSVSYGDSLEDPDFQRDFGIGPGCESASGRAVPPVRLRETIANVTGTDGMYQFSICGGDFSPAFSALAAQIIQRLP